MILFIILPMKGRSDKDAQKKQSKGSINELRKPLQVLKLNKKDTEIDSANDNSLTDVKAKDNLNKNVNALSEIDSDQTLLNKTTIKDKPTFKAENENDLKVNFEGMHSLLEEIKENQPIFIERKVDEFDFDENEFLAALNENQPIGLTGEIIKGKIIATESDGLYIDIGGKAPGFMPKKECGLGVIMNFKEKFPIGLEMEVLVIKEQNADGMVTVSARALILRKSWENICQVAKNGEIIEVLINGFNRGGLTCDVDGLRGFIPRSQLENGSDYQALVGKNIKAAFLEVNPETRKLVLSQKKATLVTKFSKLALGQLIEGKVLAVKPYGFFVDLGGASGLLHQSSVTKGNIRDLREVFVEGEQIKALINEIDLEKGRIGLDTSLLENSPGELLINKEKVLLEAEIRAQKAQSLFNKKEV